VSFLPAELPLAEHDIRQLSTQIVTLLNDDRFLISIILHISVIFAGQYILQILRHIGCVHTDMSTRTCPGFGLRLVEASLVRVERSQRLVQEHN